jgi:hypothetical protein
MANNPFASISGALSIADGPLLTEDTIPLPAVIPPVELIPSPPDGTDSTADFEFARKNLVSTIEIGQTLLHQISAVTAEAESSKMFEVAATLLTTQINAVKSLLFLHGQHRKLKGESTPSTVETTNNIEQAMFVGSTTELQAMLRKGKD